MENDILDSLEQLGYSGPLLQDQALRAAAETGLASCELLELWVWLSSRLKELCGLEATLTSGADDSESVRVELCGLLRELQCPFESLVSGILNGRPQQRRDLLQCVLFLCSELQAAQILRSREASLIRPVGAEAEELRTICDTLQLQPISAQNTQLLPHIHSQVEQVLARLPGRDCGRPALKKTLSSEQWAKLQQINRVLSSEYECRRRMLIKRLDVTIQSFGWSDRAKVKVDLMASVYQPRRHSLSLSSSVNMSTLLATREDLCNVVKTSSGATREKTCCAINKVLMGRVPDRGGRPDEISPPPPEMPPWQKRQDGGGGGGRGRGSWNQGHGGHWGGHGGQGGGGYGRYSGHGGKRGRYHY